MRLIRVSGIVLALMACLAASPSRAASGLAPIEIRLVAQEAKGGPSLVVEGGGRRLEVETETLLGPADFASVGEVEWVEGKPGFNVGLTAAGSEKYERVSTDNVGRTLAIIAGGKVLMTAKILDPVKARGFLLTVNSEAEARELAASLRRAIAPR
jgi:preprotein translocase subunit SecD